MGLFHIPGLGPKSKERRRVSFDSPEFDSLAERMGASSFLEKNPHKRYVSVKGLRGAASYKKRVYVGRELFEQLTDGQRSAIVAHEFVHLRSKDGQYRFRHVSLPIYLLILAFFLSPSLVARFSRPGPTFELVWFLLLIGFLAWIYIAWVLLTLANAKTFREQELRCDQGALQFVTAEDLIEGLKKSQALVTPKERRRWRYRILSRTYPSIEERIQAIKQAGASRTEAQ